MYDIAEEKKKKKKEKKRKEKDDENLHQIVQCLQYWLSEVPVCLICLPSKNSADESLYQVVQCWLSDSTHSV